MKALRVRDKSLHLDDVAVPAADGEVLVRIVKSGICNTDIEIARGYAGFNGTIGHEFVGVVEDSAEAGELAGKRVVGEINVGCGICALCLAGDPRHCPDRTVLGIKGRDGAHAEYLTLPARNLITVPDSVSDDHAVFAEPLAAAYGITERAAIGPDERVAVIGDGKLGLLCALTMALGTENVVLIGRHKEKLRLASDAGIEAMLVARLSKSLRGTFDVVVEASGSESGFAAALDLVRPRGRIVLKSTFQGMPKWEAWRVVVDEITIVGSRCGRLAPAIDLLAGERIKVDGLISEQYRLADSVNAMKRAGEKGVLKVILNNN